MAYYRTCPRCNGNLDPGERCTCIEKSEQLSKRFSLLTTVTDNGQIEIGGLHERKGVGNIGAMP